MIKTLATFATLIVFAATACVLLEPKTQAQQTATRASAKELILELDDKTNLKLVRISAGKFLMGSPESEKDRGNGEIQHEVTISKPFYMGATHVTVSQFAAFAKDSGYKTDAEKEGHSPGFEIKDGAIILKEVNGNSWRNPGFKQSGDHPVVQISWNDAAAFCGWLSKKSGKNVVLPTEAQWEYASRAGAKTAYPWGDNPDDGKNAANCADQSLKKTLPNAPDNWTFFSWNDGFVFTSPVTSFKANPFGLYDMTGNAWQWCSDRYGDFDNRSATDPTGPTTGEQHVLRGGSWIIFPKFCRTANRFKDDPDIRDIDDGFRVVVITDEK